MNWQAFWSMGGYGVYVWPAYGIALVLLAANALLPWLQSRGVRARVRAFIARRNSPT